jgi:hypothetical protein
MAQVTTKTGDGSTTRFTLDAFTIEEKQEAFLVVTVAGTPVHTWDRVSLREIVFRVAPANSAAIRIVAVYPHDIDDLLTRVAALEAA